MVFPKSILILCLILFSTNGFCQSSIREAKTAYNHVELNECRSIYNRIINSSSTMPSDKAEALQNIGIQDWTFFHNYEKAVKNLNLALDQNISKSKTYLLLSQVNLETGDFSKAFQNIQKALATNKNETDKIEASLLKAKIIYAESEVIIRKGKNPDKSKLLAAADLLKFVLQKQPGSPDASEILIGISLMRKSGSDVLKAWKSYYFITEEKNINSVLQPAYKVFKAILPQWNQQNLSVSQRKDLIKAFAGSNFYDYATLLASYKMFGENLYNISHKELIQINYFNQFINGIKKINNSFYPKIATGIKNYEAGYTTAITNVAKELWNKIDKENTHDNYTEEKFFAVIEKKFGAMGYVGNTNGFVSMLLGLIIHNEVNEVIQYGYKATFRYVSISRLISKDFTTWYGSANVGGWGTASSMIQVRDAYLQAPFTRLGWVTNKAAYTAIIEEIEKAKESDLLKSNNDKYAEPSFLKNYFRLKASECLFDSLQRAGLKNEELYFAFIAETLRLNIESTVFGHEGRHAIDQLLFKKDFDAASDDEKELRAKYSEIVFSPANVLANTGSILGSDLDTTTSHGKANFRLRKIIVEWMEKHTDEITGLDAKLPMLIQLPLLSDMQIKNICIEADPLANKTN